MDPLCDVDAIHRSQELREGEDGFRPPVGRRSSQSEGASRTARQQVTGSGRTPALPATLGLTDKRSPHCRSVASRSAYADTAGVLGVACAAVFGKQTP